MGFLLTLKELLASIFLEECFMLNRTMKVVKHQLEDWEDFLFGVSGIVSDSCILKELVMLTRRR
jgi:hypothetical protein